MKFINKICEIFKTAANIATQRIPSTAIPKTLGKWQKKWQKNSIFIFNRQKLATLALIERDLEIATFLFDAACKDRRVIYSCVKIVLCGDLNKETRHHWMMPGLSRANSYLEILFE